MSLIQNLKNIFTREKFETIATLKTTVIWSNTQTKKKVSEDTITWYMEQGDRGSRRYHYHSFGDTKKTKSEHRYEAELILWKKTGILPEDAEAIDFTAIKRASK